VGDKLVCVYSMPGERHVLIQAGGGFFFGQPPAEKKTIYTPDDASKLIISSTAFYSLVIGLAMTSVATIGISIAFGVYAANNPSGVAETANEVPYGMLLTSNGDVYPNTVIRSVPAATNSIDQTTSTTQSSTQAEQRVVVTEFRNFNALPSQTATITESVEARTLVPSRDYRSYAPDLTKEQVDASFRQVHKHLDIHYNVPHAYLYADGRFQMAHRGDPVSLTCFCLGETQDQNIFCEPMQVKEGNAIGCLTSGCTACLGVLNMPPHGPPPTNGITPVTGDTTSGTTIEAVFLRQELQNMVQTPVVSTVEYGPVTDVNYWNEAPFADLPLEQVEAILRETGSYAEKDENKLVWAMYRVQQNRKALMVVPKSKLPPDAFYLHGPLSAKPKCHGGCLDAEDPDKAYHCYPYNHMFYMACGGCTSNCRFVFTY